MECGGNLSGLVAGTRRAFFKSALAPAASDAESIIISKVQFRCRQREMSQSLSAFWQVANDNGIEFSEFRF
jgi:hypothetical protein